MATHTSVLAWRIPGTEGLVGCRLWGRTVGHDWSDTAADREDGRLAPQNNHLTRVLMPVCFIDQREGSSEEEKSEGIIERERQWGSKVKGSSVLQNISKGMASLWKGYINLFYSQVGREKLSLHQLKKGSLVYSQAVGQGSPGESLSMIKIITHSLASGQEQGGNTAVTINRKLD